MSLTLFHSSFRYLWSSISFHRSSLFHRWGLSLEAQAFWTIRKCLSWVLGIHFDTFVRVEENVGHDNKNWNFVDSLFCKLHQLSSKNQVAKSKDENECEYDDNNGGKDVSCHQTHGPVKTSYSIENIPKTFHWLKSCIDSFVNWQNIYYLLHSSCSTSWFLLGLNHGKHLDAVLHQNWVKLGNVPLPLDRET